MKRFWVLCFVFFVSLGYSQDFEKRFRDYGLVDITTLDSTIKVKLMYATTANFTGKAMYGTMKKAYLQPEMVKMIVQAQELLKQKNPNYSLLVLDAARPMSVQRKMFSLVAGTPNNIYVANPAKGGGRHNYGAAVDVTIVDKSGDELDMGSPVDFFGPESHLDAAEKGLISKNAIINRKLLIEVMQKAGFTVHPKEWWHFHKYTVEELKRRYMVLEF